jgi:hypothetical protein
MRKYYHVDILYEYYWMDGVRLPVYAAIRRPNEVAIKTLEILLRPPSCTKTRYVFIVVDYK